MSCRYRRIEFTVNALCGENAVDIAIGAAGNVVFSDPGEVTDQEYMDDTCELKLRSINELGGYRLTVIRKSFLSERIGTEYDYEYGIEKFSGPLACFESPDLIDTSPAYIAEMNAKEMTQNTHLAHKKNIKSRL